MSWAFIVQHGTHVQMMACALSAASVIISYNLPHPETWVTTIDWYQNATADTVQADHRRELRAGGGGDGASATTDMQLTNEGAWALLWAVQGVSCLLLMIHLSMTLFLANDRLNILFKTIYEMLRNDVSVFMAVFSWLFFAFYLCLFILYPRSGVNELPQVEKFNKAHTAAFALLDLSLLGESIGWDFYEDSFEHVSSAQVAVLFI